MDDRGIYFATKTKKMPPPKKARAYIVPIIRLVSNYKSFNYLQHGCRKTKYFYFKQIYQVEISLPIHFF